MYEPSDVLFYKPGGVWEKGKAASERTLRLPRDTPRRTHRTQERCSAFEPLARFAGSSRNRSRQSTDGRRSASRTRQPFLPLPAPKLCFLFLFIFQGSQTLDFIRCISKRKELFFFIKLILVKDYNNVSSKLVERVGAVSK